MTRRAVIHYKKSDRVRSMASFAGDAHLHFCSGRSCRLIYEDACRDPHLNGRCPSCKGVRRPVWMSSRDPADCCWGNCQQVTETKELRRYALAGPGPWYQCRTCARAHGWPCA